MNAPPLKELPNPFWALMFMVLGCGLLVAVLFKVSDHTSQLEIGVLMAIATAGTNLVSGAFGYIQGRNNNDNHSLQIPADGGSSVNATVTTTSAPAPAAAPAPIPGASLAGSVYSARSNPGV